MNNKPPDGRAWRRKKIVDGRLECYRCKEWKTLDDFYPDKRMSSGFRARCKQCDIETTNAHHTNNLDRAIRNLWIRHKTNGRTGSRRRKEFTDQGCVTPELLMELWNQQSGLCAVTGIRMTHIQGSGFRVWTNVTLDRIDPDGPYTKNNIRLVCRAVNYMKAAMSDEEMLKWAGLILNGTLAGNNQTPRTQELSEARQKEKTVSPGH